LFFLLFSKSGGIMKNDIVTTIKKSLVLPGVFLTIVLQSQNGFAFDAHKIFFAGDSGATWCRASASGPDLSIYSMFSSLKASPPPGFIIEPEQAVPTSNPCSSDEPGTSGYGGLKILDWYTLCTDPAGTGVCSWSCTECPETNCPVNNNGKLIGTTNWCCCASRRACIDQSDAQYVILELVANDLWQLYRYYNRDVDRVVEQAKALTAYLTGAGRKVIWVSYAPIGYGSFGGGEVACSSWLACLDGINSNTEYFYSKFIPWLITQDNVYLIDFFTYVKNTYGANYNFINQYGFDSIHLKPDGHQIYYDFVYRELLSILSSSPSTTTIHSTTSTTTTISVETTTSTTTSILQTTTSTSSVATTTTTAAPIDSDGDGSTDLIDTCPYICNPQQRDADGDGIGDVCDTSPNCGGCGQAACELPGQCDSDHDGIIDDSDNCPAVCNARQLDADGDGTGDACDSTPGCGGCGQPACEAVCTLL
jgi:hypothetical protein